MAFQILKRSTRALFWTAFIISLTVVVSAAQDKPVIQVSDSTITHGMTKSIKVSGSGFTPDTVVTIGVEGVGRHGKVAAEAKDLWLGLAKVNRDHKFEQTIHLRNSLWRVKGLSGTYTLIVQDDLGKKSTAPILIKAAQKKAKKKK